MTDQISQVKEPKRRELRASVHPEHVVVDGFDLNEFVRHFAVFAESAGGVLRLRQLVLGLALRGGLSGENSSAKNRTPGDWRRVKVGEVAECVLGKMLDASKHTKGTKRPYLRNINVRWGTVDLSDLREMFFKDEELDRYGVRLGDVLICEGGEPGRAAVWTDPRTMLIQKAIHRVRPSTGLLPAWLVLNLRYDTWSQRLDELFTGATIKHFTGRALESYEIPLPPLAEQKRIVAKVDQLMALCDELEARQTKKRETSTRLTKSALEALTTADSPEEFKVAWTRIVANFDLLVDEPDKVAELRVVLRLLAVTGRLGRQEPNDEPGAELLRRLGGVQRAQPENQQALPSGWCWASFDDVAQIESNLVSPARFPDLPHVAPDNIQKGTGRLLDYRTVREDGVISSKSHFFPGQIVYSKIRPNLSKAVVVDFEGLCSADMYPLRARIDTGYLHLFLLSPVFLAQVVRDDNRLAMPKVNQEQLNRTLIAVPPLTEQKRIVAEVDRLMRKCDELDARFVRAAHCASRFVTAVIQEVIR